MASEASNAQVNTRRVRPWIAALLTFLGWGVGFFYARRTRAAIWWAVVPSLLGLLLGLGLWLYMLRTNAAPGFLGSVQPWMLDAANLGLTALVAIFAWIAAAHQREVEQGPPSRLLGYLAIWLVPLLASLAIAMSIRFFYVQPFRIPSGNMEPTLHVGDYVIVSKSSYGYGPYSTAPLVGLIQRDPASIRAPERGDIAVFRPRHEPDRDFVKRVVGLPGDHIQMVRGALHINGAPVRLAPLAPVEIVSPYAGVQSVMAFRETLPNGVSYTVLDAGQTELDNTREFVVPAGNYFLMGDHRDNSDDSRRSVGYVPIDNFVGRVDHIIRSGGARE